MVEKTSYDVLDKILQESQQDRGTGTGGKVWVSSPNHPDRGYWCDESEANMTWQTFTEVDEIERYLRTGG